ncbi:hypothetical protein BDR22DRAFT_177373 [Usnea florida]
MKSWVTISWLFLFPSIRAAALPQLIGDELESTSSPLKRDAQGNLAPRSTEPDFAKPESKGSKREYLPEAVASLTDDPSLDPFSNLKRDLSSRSPQGPRSNPGEFIGVGISRVNPANHDTSSGSSSSSSPEEGNSPPARELLMEDDGEKRHHRHHNGSHHYDLNGTHHEHRKTGILAELNSHGEHIVVYNGTHFSNGTRYSPANTTMNGAKLINETVIDGDEIAVYRKPYNRHHHHNLTGGSMPTPTGVWLPSGTGWIPSSTGKPRHHRKVPSQDLAGFRGPKRKGYWKDMSNTLRDEVVY